jgi:DNA replication initiation complex subunit (GINS family)
LFGIKKTLTPAPYPYIKLEKYREGQYGCTRFLSGQSTIIRTRDDFLHSAAHASFVASFYIFCKSFLDELEKKGHAFTEAYKLRDYKSTFTASDFSEITEENVRDSEVFKAVMTITNNYFNHNRLGKNAFIPFLFDSKRLFTQCPNPTQCSSPIYLPCESHPFVEDDGLTGEINEESLAERILSCRSPEAIEALNEDLRTAGQMRSIAKIRNHVIGLLAPRIAGIVKEEKGFIDGYARAEAEAKAEAIAKLLVEAEEKEKEKEGEKKKGQKKNTTKGKPVGGSVPKDDPEDDPAENRSGKNSKKKPASKNKKSAVVAVAVAVADTVAAMGRVGTGVDDDSCPYKLIITNPVIRVPAGAGTGAAAGAGGAAAAVNVTAESAAFPFVTPVAPEPPAPASEPPAPASEPTPEPAPASEAPTTPVALAPEASASEPEPKAPAPSMSEYEGQAQYYYWMNHIYHENLIEQVKYYLNNQDYFFNYFVPNPHISNYAKEFVFYHMITHLNRIYDEYCYESYHYRLFTRADGEQKSDSAERGPYSFLHRYKTLYYQTLHGDIPAYIVREYAAYANGAYEFAQRVSEIASNLYYYNYVQGITY